MSLRRNPRPPFHPSLRSLLLAHRFETDSQAARSARESVKDARLKREASEKRLYPIDVGDLPPGPIKDALDQAKREGGYGG